MSGVVAAGAAHAADSDGRAIAMSNITGWSGPQAQSIEGGTAGDTESNTEFNTSESDTKSKNFVSPEKRAMARKYFSQSMTLKKQGDNGGALIGFLKATREDPTLLDAYYEQALIFREKGFHKLAASRLEQALAIKPKYQKARLLLATVQLELGNVPDAVQQLGKSLGLEKDQTKPSEPKPKDEPLPPPMILQALHPSLPVPKVAKPEKAAEDSAPKQAAIDSSTPKTIELGALDQFENNELNGLKTQAKPKKLKRGTRQKIRDLMARKRRKYGKYTSQKKQKHWIARIFTVPEPFRFLQGKQSAPEESANEGNDLQPRALKADKSPNTRTNSKEAIAKAPDSKEFSSKQTNSMENSPVEGTRESAAREAARSEKARKELIAKELSAKELERKFETTIARIASENANPPSTVDPNSKPPWPNWHRPLPPNQSKEEKANQEFERARKTANAYKPSSSAYEPEMWSHADSPDKRRDEKANSDGFKLPNSGSPKSGWLGITALASGATRGGAARRVDHRREQAKAAEPPEYTAGCAQKVALPEVAPPVEALPADAPPAEAPQEDPWTKRLRDLNENGTGSLKKGEAFMFSEDTGEAVLFLADGQKIRRVIADPVSSDELLKLRRPDVLVPKELFYDTSLLGKVVPASPAPPPPAAVSPASTPPPAFKIENLMDSSSSFLGWLKGLVHL